MEINVFEKIEEKQLKDCNTKQLMDVYVLDKLMGVFSVLSIVLVPIVFELALSLGVVGFLLLLPLFCYSFRFFSNSKKIGEELRNNRAKSDSNVLATIKEERKKGITKISIFVVVMLLLIGLVFSTGPIMENDNHSNRHNSEPNEGYWGDDGYYNPSDDEMDDVWNDVNNWMDENWD